MANLNPLIVKSYADLVEAGRRTLESVPEPYRLAVSEELVRRHEESQRQEPAP